MHITIFGASGKVGRLVVAEALARGHSVTGFVHSHSSIGNKPNLRIYQGDIHTQHDVTTSLQGSQAVISALGSWSSWKNWNTQGSHPKDIVAAGTRSIITAMHAHGISRVISLTGTEAYDMFDAPDILRKTAHLAAHIGAGKILRDGEDHIKLLRGSDLDWTVLRSPVMTNGAAIFYRLTLKPMPPWQIIPRRAVAKALVDQLDGPGYVQASPFIYGR